MKADKVTYRMGFPLYALVWGVVYAVIWALVRWKIDQDFDVLYEKSIVVNSVERYLQNMRWILIITAVFSLIWWLWAYSRLSLRAYFEKNTILLALLFIGVLAVIVLSFVLYGSAIIDELQQPYTYLCPWWFLMGFIFNLFSFPPRNVRCVMCPYGNLGRIGIAAVTLAGTAVLVIL